MFSIFCRVFCSACRRCSMTANLRARIVLQRWLQKAPTGCVVRALALGFRLSGAVQKRKQEVAQQLYHVMQADPMNGIAVRAQGA